MMSHNAQRDPHLFQHSVTIRSLDDGDICKLVIFFFTTAIRQITVNFSIRIQSRWLSICLFILDITPLPFSYKKGNGTKSDYNGSDGDGKFCKYIFGNVCRDQFVKLAIFTRPSFLASAPNVIFTNSNVTKTSTMISTKRFRISPRPLTKLRRSMFTIFTSIRIQQRRCILTITSILISIRHTPRSMKTIMLIIPTFFKSHFTLEPNESLGTSAMFVLQ
mmetsp:Transcript_17584/g.26294  ORF Transcript_17584/g.26294 Transcript_17584/m.26294 type:complete len:219 (-) Transcript_17584:1701-2357(-)